MVGAARPRTIARVSRAVEPEEISAITRELAAATAGVARIRTRLSDRERPLAWLASLRLETVEASLGTALEALDGLGTLLENIAADDA